MMRSRGQLLKDLMKRCNLYLLNCMRIPILLVVILGISFYATTTRAQDAASLTDESGAKNGQPAPVAFVHVARPTRVGACSLPRMSASERLLGSHRIA